jgi:phytanoyl-CoA hydroxylase
MSFAALKPQYDRDGFVIVRQFLSPAEFAEVKRELDRYVSQVVPTLPDSHAFYIDRSKPETLKQMQHMEVDPFFREYVKHPRWTDLAAALVGEPVVAQPSEWFNKPPRSNSPTPTHQDNYYFNLKPPNVITIWLALDKVDEGNGCLRYVRGSHANGVRPHGRSEILGFSQGITDFGDHDREREVPMLLEPGDAIAHHGNTIHRAEPNNSDRNRRAFAMVLKGISCQRDEEAFARYTEALKAQHNKMGLKT